MEKVIDADHNGGVSRDELQQAIAKTDSYVFKALGWGGGIAMVFKNCDYDQNGEITARDMKMSTSTCFATPVLRCAMKSICKK